MQKNMEQQTERKTKHQEYIDNKIAAKNLKHVESVKNSIIRKLEEANIRREGNLLKRYDQLENHENIKRLHRENMLKIQAKHFGFEI